MPSQQHRESGAGTVLTPVVADAVAGLGYELEELKVGQAGNRRLVTVVVDRAVDTADPNAVDPNAGQGIDLDDVAEISRTVSTALDAHDDVLGGAYTLEVTSPGIGRPLTKPRHWRRARSRLVKVTTTDGRTFTGRVGDAQADPDGAVRVLVDGALRTLAYAEVTRAAVEVEFAQPPASELALLNGTDAREESR